MDRELFTALPRPGAGPDVATWWLTGGWSGQAAPP